MQKTVYIFIIALAIHLIISPLVYAEYASEEKQTLPKVKAIDVVIEDPSIGNKSGLTEEQMRTDVELKLRLAGFTIEKTDLSVPYLHIVVTALEITGDKTNRLIGIAWNARVGFRQIVASKYQNQTFIAESWHRATLGTIDTYGNFRNAARQKVKDFVDEFLNDYLSVHPIEKQE